MAIRRPAKIKMRKKIKAMIEGDNGREAAMKAFPYKSSNAAMVSSCKAKAMFDGTGMGVGMDKEQALMPQILDAYGLSDERLAMLLREKTEAKVTKFFTHNGMVVDSRITDDHRTQLKALELAGRWKGHDVRRNVNMNLNVNKKLSPDDIEALTPEELDYYISSVESKLATEEGPVK